MPFLIIDYRMVISIHTKDCKEKLGELFDSLKHNHELSCYPLIIVDTSSRADIVYFNARRYQNNNKLQNVLYVDQYKWTKIRSIIRRENLVDQDFKKLLLKINLGKHAWDISEAKNVSFIISLLLARRNEFCIKLDHDIIIPASFSLPREHGTLLGINFSGCPDLSRLEWIQLYLKTLSNRDDDRIRTECYVDQCIHHLGRRRILAIINKYTELLAVPVKQKRNQFCIFLHRSELSWGAFVSSIVNFTKTMSPPWYEEDWFWFQSLRKGKPVFTDRSVIHNANRKRVLAMADLQREEVGKILTHPLRESNKLTLNILKSYLRYRLILLEETIDLCSLVYDQNNLEAGIHDQIRKIATHLQKLHRFVSRIDLEKLFNKYHEFKINETIWRNNANKLIGSMSLKEMISL